MANLTYQNIVDIISGGGVVFLDCGGVPKLIDSIPDIPPDLTICGFVERNLSEYIIVGSPANGQIPAYNSTTSKLQWTTPASGGGAWGTITGTLSSQSDLQSALSGKANTSDNLSVFAATTSLQLKNLISDETGSESLVFRLAPTLKNIVVNQNQNNDDMILATRATDSSPTGTFINYRNAAASQIYKVGIDGSTYSQGLFLNSSTGSVQWGDNGSFGSIRGFLGTTADGIFRFGDSAGGGSPQIILGSAGASTGIRLKRSSTTLALRNGDDTADATLTAANTTLTSTSANALLVTTGTNPVLQVDNSTVSSATGLKITGAASGSGITLAALGGTNENITLTPKGTGSINVTHSASINSDNPVLNITPLLNTVTNTTYYGTRVTGTIRPTSSNTAVVVMFNSTAIVDSSNPPSATYGVQATTNHNAVGTLSVINGFFSTAAVYGASSATSALNHITVGDVFTNGLGTVATQYGVRIPVLVNAQTNWALFTEGATNSSLGGKLGLNRSSTIAAQLDVSSSAGYLTPAKFWHNSTPSSPLGIWLDSIGQRRYSIGLPATDSQTVTMIGGKGENVQDGTLSENITLSTVATTTDSTIQLPAGSMIVGITARITQTITGSGVTSLSIGDASNTTRFTSAGLGLTVSQTLTALSSSVQTAAAAVRITANGGTPTAGQVLLTINYTKITPAYSALDKMSTGNPFSQSRIVFDGDSLTFGTGIIGGETYPSQVISLLGGANPTNNFGVSGQGIAAMISDGVSQIDSLYNAANGRDTVVYWGGTNDIAFSSGQATATYNNIVAYGTARRAAGWRTYVLTLLPRSDAGVQGSFETDRQTVNSSIRTNWATFADGLIDVAADSRIGDAGDQTDTRYYNTDLVHLNNAGARVVAELVAAAIQPANTNTITGTILRNTAPSSTLAAAEFQAASGADTSQTVLSIKNPSGVATFNVQSGGTTNVGATSNAGVLNVLNSIGGAVIQANSSGGVLLASAMG
jgi:lysophospholipase L1-like esterase